MLAGRMLGGIGFYAAVIAFVVFALFPIYLDPEDIGDALVAALFRGHHCLAEQGDVAKLCQRVGESTTFRATFSTARGFGLDRGARDGHRLGRRIRFFAVSLSGKTSSPFCCFSRRPFRSSWSSRRSIASWEACI